MKNERPVTGPPAASWSILDPPRYRERIAFAFVVSLYIHGLILVLRFGAAGFGLPWAEPRVQGAPLTVRLVDAPRPAAPVPATAPVPLAAAPRVSPPTVTAERPKPITSSRAESSFEVQLPEAVDAVPPPTELSLPRRETRAPAPAAKARARDRKIRAKPQPQILAQSAPQQEPFKVPPPKVAEPEPQRAPESVAKKQTEEPLPPVQATDQAARRQAEEAARLQAEDAARQRAEEDARQRALALQKELEARKQEEARRLEEAKKQDEARRQALALEARRRAEETARQEKEELARQRALALQKEEEAKRLADSMRLEETRKQDAARIQEETKKQEEARRMALEVEALRRAEDAARQQARQKELEAQRQAEEAAARAKEAAERQRAEAEAAAQRERERLAAERAPATAPGPLSGRDLAAKALEALRTPGAARDDVLRPGSPPASAESPRRRSLFGVERDVGLRMYVESWRWKIERNGALNYRPSAGWNARDNPIVTVSIRSDGSLEDVSIHRSSGVRELDEAVRRIARLNAPYSAFPPDLARQYDVIDIRRVWFFDSTLRILDEM